MSISRNIAATLPDPSLQVSILLVLACPAQVAAQVPGSEQGPPIVVTGEALPTRDRPGGGSAGISRERLERTASGLIEEALAGAGIAQFRRSDSRSSNPTSQGLTLRALGGNATSRAAVLLDGVPLADPFFGSVPLTALDPAMIERIEIVRGGGGLDAAPGNVAGTIRLFSAGPDRLGRASAELLANDRGELDASGALAARLGGGAVIVSGGYAGGPGFWTTPADQRSTASVPARFAAWNAGVRIAAPLADGELQARIGLFGDDRTLRFAGADSTARGQDASLRIVGRGGVPYEVAGYVQMRDFSTVTVSAASLRPVLDQASTPSTGTGLQFELRPEPASWLKLQLGGSWRRGEGRANENALASSGAVTERRQAGGRSDVAGVFVQGEVLMGRVSALVGGRVDRWALSEGQFTAVPAGPGAALSVRYPVRRGTEGSATAGLSYGLGTKGRIRAAYGSTFRLPTLNELYRPFTVFPVRTEANAALAPERNRSFEIGLDYAPAPWASLSVSAYRARLSGAIANVTIATNLRQRRNLPAIRSTGFEAELHLTGKTVSLDGFVAVADARVESGGIAPVLDGKRPAQTAAVTASASLSWRPAPGWQFTGSLRHTGAQFEDDLGKDRLPPATTLDLFGEVPLTTGAALVVRAENMTGARTVTRNQGGSIDLGVPRTIWLGARIKVR